LAGATNFTDLLYKTVKKLFIGFDLKGRKVRLVGVRASGLIDAGVCDSIFVDEKKEKVHKAIDKIKGKFGDNAIYRARIRKAF